jgi:ABC-2 type transport system permease protein
LDSTQGFHALMNLVLMPLWLLSGALFPAEGAAGWVKVAIRLNPVHYAFEALRYSLQPDHLFSMGWITSLMGFIGFTAVLVCICLAVTTRYAGRNP